MTLSSKTGCSGEANEVSSSSSSLSWGCRFGAVLEECRIV